MKIKDLASEIVLNFLGILFFLFHSIFIIICALAIIIFPKEPDICLIYIIPVMIDKIAIKALLWAGGCVGLPNLFPSNDSFFLLMPIYLILVGGLQWYVVGTLIYIIVRPFAGSIAKLDNWAGTVSKRLF